MRRGILALLFSAVLAVVAAPALAAGPYLGLEGGVVFLSDSSVSETVVSNSGDLKYDTGWGIGLAGGYDFGTYRLELELAYRSNGVKEFSGAGGTDPLSGDMSSTALMLNAFYDFKTLSKVVYPYLGVGIGGANVSADVSDNGGKVLDDSDFVFAYQFIAGVAFPVSKQLAIDLNYRYFATTDPSFEIVNSGGVKLDSEYASHNIFVGLRYNF